MTDSGQHSLGKDSRALASQAAVRRPVSLSGEHGQKADSQAPARCPVGSCPIARATPGELAAHLNLEHGWRGQEALDKAEKLFGAETPGLSLVAPTTPKEDSMPSKKGQHQPPMTERTCGACGKKGHRSDHCPAGKPAAARNEKPAPAKDTPAGGGAPKHRKGPTCGYCHRTGGTHSEGCKKKSCKICARSASGKCGWHSDQRWKPGPKGTRSEKPAGRPTTGVLVGAPYLTQLKYAITEYERKASLLREALAILGG